MFHYFYSLLYLRFEFLLFSGSIIPTLKIERLPSAPTGKDLSSLYHKYPGGVLPEDLLPYKVISS